MRTDESRPDRSPRITFGRAGRKFVRLDRPSGAVAQGGAAANAAAPGAEPEGWQDSGRLIDLVRRAVASSSRDRRERGGVRHDVVERDVWVGWWSGDEFGAVLGQFVNISRGGAMVVLDRRPPRRQPIWLYKDVGPSLACVRGEVAGLTPAPGGSYRARFRFAAPCPTILCQAVVCGQPGRPANARPRSPAPAPPPETAG